MENNTYTIFIRNERLKGGGGGGRASPREAGTAAPGHTATGGQQKENADFALDKALAKVWAASAFIRTGIRAGIGLIGRNMGNSYVRDVTNAAFDIGKIAAGTVVAGMIKPWMAGAYLGGVAIDLLVQAEQANFDRRWENENLTRLRERAGVSFNRSRKRI